ncbi:MAG: alpha/beta fold hydrolase [Acidaminococcaceae bacterium]|jgi:carboxylesterase|nr:alpha/beta fold hydrolase [Acidaminococcaceae bacterium]
MIETVKPETAAYFLPGGPCGVLLVHGYTGTPMELRPLGDYLAAQGFTVLGVRLPGHGSTWQNLEQTTWPEWYAAVVQGVQQLQERCQNVSVAGLSLGGLLAVKAAAELPLASVVLMSTPIYVRDWRAPFLKYLQFFIRRIRRHKFQGSELRKKYDFSYADMPLKPLPSLFALRDLCRDEYLGQITVPALVIQSTAERTVKPASAQFIYEHLGSRHKQLLWLQKSGHVLTLDEESPLVCAAVGTFLKEYGKNGTGERV